MADDDVNATLADDTYDLEVGLEPRELLRELLDLALPARDLLFRLFHERGVRVFEHKPVRHACRCNRERVKNTLASFPKVEINAIKEDDVISVTCEFCGLDYIFDETDLRELYV